MNSIIDQSHGNARIEIDLRAGARIASLEIEGNELLVGRNSDPIGWGLYPMVPYAGRVRNGRFHYRGIEYSLPVTTGDHAIHGTVLAQHWTPESENTYICDLGKSWPFAGFARQSIQLTASAVSLHLEVHTDDPHMPASCGWHPWFVRKLQDSSAELKFDPGYMLERDSAGITTATSSPPTPGPWDDCFGDVAPYPSIRWPGVLSLSIESDCRYWVVYNQPEHALCVEPQTAPPDNLNQNPQIVEPGKPLEARMTLRWGIET